MKILFHNQGIEPTEIESAEMTEKLENLERFVSHEEPVILDVYLIDESAKVSKNGLDQSVHLSVLLGGEKIIIEETTNHHMQSFAKAYHRLKQTLEKHHQKHVDESHG